MLSTLFFLFETPIKYAVFRMKPEAPDFDPTRFRLTPGIKKEALDKLNYRKPE